METSEHSEDLGLAPQTLRRVVSAVMHAEVVDYSPKDGVRCPVCGVRLTGGRMGVRRTSAWCGCLRERYHTCPVCGMRFKSVEAVQS
jgi:rubredoxin